MNRSSGRMGAVMGGPARRLWVGLVFSLVILGWIVGPARAGAEADGMYGVLEQYAEGANLVEVPLAAFAGVEWVGLYPVMSSGDSPVLTILGRFGETREVIWKTTGSGFPMARVREETAKLGKGDPDALLFTLGDPAQAAFGLKFRSCPRWRILLARGRVSRPRRSHYLMHFGPAFPPVGIQMMSKLLSPGDALQVEVLAGTFQACTVEGMRFGKPLRRAELYRGPGPLIPVRDLLAAAERDLPGPGPLSFQIDVNGGMRNPQAPPCLALVAVAPQGQPVAVPRATGPEHPVRPLVTRIDTPPPGVATEEESDGAFLGTLTRSGNAPLVPGASGVAPSPACGPEGSAGSMSGGTGSGISLPLSDLAKAKVLSVIPGTGEFLWLNVSAEIHGRRHEIWSSSTRSIPLEPLREAVRAAGGDDATRLSIFVNEPRIDPVTGKPSPCVACQVTLMTGRPVPQAGGLFLRCDGKGFAGSFNTSFDSLRPDDVYAYEVRSGDFRYWNFEAWGAAKTRRTIYRGTDNRIGVQRLLDEARRVLGDEEPRHLCVSVNGTVDLGEVASCVVYVYRIDGASRRTDPPEPKREKGRDDPASLAAAADQGDARAMRLLGLRHLRGEGFPADRALAETWLKRAAEAGDRPALFFLGDLYYNAKYGTVDPEKAIAWFEKAARQGDEGVLDSLGTLYLPEEDEALALPPGWTAPANPWRELAPGLADPETAADPVRARGVAEGVWAVLDRLPLDHPDGREILGSLLEAGQRRAVEVFLAKARGVASLTLSGWSYLLPPAGRHPDGRALLDRAVADGLVLPGWPPSAPASASAADAEDWAPPRADQERFVAELEERMASPTVDPTIYEGNVQAGIDPEVARKLAGTMWTTGLMMTGAFDRDLRERLGASVRRHFPAGLPPWALGIHLGDLAMLPDPELVARCREFIAAHLAEVLAGPEFRRDRHEEMVANGAMEGLMAFARANPAVAVSLLAGVERLPSDRRGVFLREAVRQACRRLPPDAVLPMLEARLPEFRLVAARRLLEPPPGFTGGRPAPGLPSTPLAAEEAAQTARSVLVALATGPVSPVAIEAWLTLAENGDPAAVPPLIENLAGLPAVFGKGPPDHRLVRDRLLIGLTNLAQADPPSGLAGLLELEAVPDPAGEEARLAAWQTLWRDWWAAHGATVTPAGLRQAFHPD
ncbi:MAG: sel1 repeat family protein [Candidatus Riflebacteria bacterium]|nr:sel1 repeat family protein [Candidatus Riflebacteria bacterium]